LIELRATSAGIHLIDSSLSSGAEEARGTSPDPGPEALDPPGGWVRAPSIAEFPQLASFHLIRLAEWEGRAVLLCEARVGQRFPHFRQRRRWLRWILRNHPGGIVAFTDAAHSFLILAWREDPGDRHSEHRLPGVDFSLPGEMRRMILSALPSILPWSIPGEREDLPDTPAALAHALGSAILARLSTDRRSTPATPDGGASLRQARRLRLWIERLDRPDSIRAAWRAIRSIRVLDPCCESADWLLQCAGVLEPLHLTCLERMRCWTDEPRRPERLDRRRGSFFAPVLDLSEDPARHASRTLFVRRLLLQDSLFGICPSPAAQRLSSLRLAAYAGLDEPDARADMNIRARYETPVKHEPSASVRDLGTSDDALTELLEEIHGLCLGERVLRELRISGSLREGDLDRGKAEMAAWEERILGTLDALFRNPLPEHGPPSSAAILGGAGGWWLAFPTAMISGGFTLVREPG